MVAWMNEEALKQTLDTGLATFFSRSRKAIWQKGETSGNVLRVHEVYIDCDEDTVLLAVDPAGPSCHTGRPTCFFKRVGSDGRAEDAKVAPTAFLHELEAELRTRAEASASKSYNEKGKAWVESLDEDQRTRARVATFARACADAELVFNCTAGVASLEALNLAGAEALAGKILVDIANPLDFSQGMPPRLSVCNDSSLAEQIQAAFPDTKVVKTLNTVNAHVMVDPGRIPGKHVMFVSGNDAEAKRFVEGTLLREWFGWSEVLDLGDISTARGTEMYLPLWVRMWGALGTADFNLAIVKGA